MSQEAQDNYLCNCSEKFLENARYACFCENDEYHPPYDSWEQKYSVIQCYGEVILRRIKELCPETLPDIEFDIH